MSGQEGHLNLFYIIFLVQFSPHEGSRRQNSWNPDRTPGNDQTHMYFITLTRHSSTAMSHSTITFHNALFRVTQCFCIPGHVCWVTTGLRSTLLSSINKSFDASFTVNVGLEITHLPSTSQESLNGKLYAIRIMTRTIMVKDNNNITFLKIEPLLYIKMLLIQKLSQVCIIWGIFVHKTKTLAVHQKAPRSVWVDGTIPTDSVNPLTCQSGIKIQINSIQSHSQWTVRYLEGNAMRSTAWNIIC